MKRALRILAVTGALLTLFVMGVSAAEVDGCPGHENGVAVAASQTLNAADTTYYLTKDITGVTKRVTGGTTYYDGFNVTANNVTLCMNGYNITPSQSAVAVRVDNNVTGFKLCNCQSEHGGTVTGKGNNRSILMMPSSEGAIYKGVHVDNNKTATACVAIQVNGDASFAMYGGTISNNAYTTSAANTGVIGAIGGISGSTIRLLGGEISGNQIVSAANSPAAAVVSSGGTLEIGGDMVIRDNVISIKGYGAGGVAGCSGAKITMSGGTIANNSILGNVSNNGGGVMLYGEGTLFTMTGGTISGNQGERGGGVLVRNSASFAMSGGMITENTANQYGGGLCISIGSATMSGGEISGNLLTNAKAYGAQVVVGTNSTGNTFTMTDGVIAAAPGVAANDFTVCNGTASVQGGTISGKVDTIGMIKDATLNISGGTFIGPMANGELARPTGAAMGATISITGGKFGGDVNVDKLFSWLNGVTMSEIVEDNNVFYQVDSASGAACDSGHSGWTILNDSVLGGLLGYKGDGKTISTSGKYYLKANVTGSVSVSGTSCAINVTADNVTLCLGGYSVKPSGDAVAIRCSGKNLKIINCSTSNGTITGKAICSVQVVDGGSVTMGDNVHINSASVIPVLVGNQASFAMLGGTISSNTITSAVADEAVAPVVLGEDSRFVMQGGTIGSNKVTTTACGYAAGAVVALNTATVDLLGGTISSNTVSQTVPTDVENVYGYASGGVLINAGTLNIRNTVLVDGNKATSNKISSGAVQADGGTVITMTGGTLSGNTAAGTTRNGGGVALYGANTFFVMTGGTISGNNAATGGGVEIANKDAVFAMNGGTISGNTGSRWGAGVCIRKGTFNLVDGTIQDNTLGDATYKYGNQITVGLYSGNCIGTLNMVGGQIIDTDVDSLPGSTEVAVSQGVMNLSGGSITGRIGTLGILSKAELNISGGTIHGAVTNAMALPVNKTDSETYNDTEEGMEVMRKDCIINMTGGELFGTLVETSSDNRAAATTALVSGGKFSSAIDRDALKEFLPWDQGVVSVLDIEQDDLIYEVGVGLVYNGAKMEFGSSLDFGLYLGADRGDFAENIEDYEIALSGADADVVPVLSVENGNLLLMAQGIAAKEMRDDITFTVKKDGEVWFDKTMSVYDAACEFRSDELRAAEELSTEPNSDYITMLADMIYYGTQAQKRFNYNLRALVDKPDLEEVSEAVYGQWESSGVAVSDGHGGKVNMSLSLKDQIQLNFYVYVPGAVVSNVTFNGESVSEQDYTVTAVDKTHSQISFHEIPVTGTKGQVAFTVTGSNGVCFDVSGSIVDYVIQAQTDSTEGKLVNALQKYVDSVIDLLCISALQVQPEEI